MKKLKLSLQNAGGAEILTREQLKKIMGGSGSGSGRGSDDGCTCGTSCTKTHPDPNGGTVTSTGVCASIGTACVCI